MDRIILIAQQISKEGKVPNTSLIKARLPKDVPLPTIIQGLKMWRQNPQQQIDEPTTLALSPCNTNGNDFEAVLEAKIQQALAPLKMEIKELKSALQQLQTEDKN